MTFGTCFRHVKHAKWLPKFPFDTSAFPVKVIARIPATVWVGEMPQKLDSATKEV